MLVGFASKLYVVQTCGLWVLGTVKHNMILAATLSLTAGHTAALDCFTQATLDCYTQPTPLFPCTSSRNNTKC